MMNIEEIIKEAFNTPKPERTELQNLLIQAYELGYNDGTEDYEMNRG